MTDADLKAWAEAHAPAGSAVAVAVLRVMEDRDRLDGLANRLAERGADLSVEVARLQRQIEGHCERIARQSELLSRRAEKETAPVSQGGGYTMLTENAGG